MVAGSNMLKVDEASRMGVLEFLTALSFMKDLARLEKPVAQ